ncbi:MAG TPA: DUF1778 domain-containing protein [Syntrophales bacterium]|nr:DUF1778 domain-containing protein [Syntrophales bacterium]
MDTSTANPRLAFRMKLALKRRIEEAAALLGLNWTDFMLSTLSERASEVVESHRNITISDPDRNRFLEALGRPGRPIPALVKKLKSHRKRHSG